MKKTLVLGASSNPARYSFLAAQRLIAHQHPVVLLGRKNGTIFGETIHNEKLEWQNIDTITLYLNPKNQKEYYDYIISLNPKRVIFNPGTENQEFKDILISKNIVPVEACTLVMLATGQY